MPTHYEGDPKNVQSLDAFIKMTRANLSLQSYLMRRGKLEGLTVTQFGVMETLYHLGSLTQGVLSSKQLKTPGNITVVIDNLERDGLVVRKRDELDHRVVHISLTPAGRERIERVFPIQAELIREAFSVLSAEELSQLSSLAKKLGKGLEEKLAAEE